MKRPIRPDEQKLWAMVAATVHAKPGRHAPPKPAAPAPPKGAGKTPDPPVRLPLAEAKPPKPKIPRFAPDDIEPGRKHRIARERDPMGARIDLHGMDQDRAPRGAGGLHPARLGRWPSLGAGDHRQGRPGRRRPAAASAGMARRPGPARRGGRYLGGA
jgi:hypothetical protein